jgi:deoxyribodipyrimidine photo-lyase
VRVRSLNDAAIRTPARYVLYWPQMNRGVEWNHVRARAAPLANELHLTLLQWAKKIIDGSPTYQDAFDTMVEIHDRYALDGRYPNTCSNVLWRFGLHGSRRSERPVFGANRRMSFEEMKRKTGVDAYLSEMERLERTA